MSISSFFERLKRLTDDSSFKSDFESESCITGLCKNLDEEFNAFCSHKNVSEYIIEGVETNI